MKLCAWCRTKPVEDPRARFCGRKCRQAAWRLRRRRTTDAQQDRPMVMAYADPPYVGLAAKYYRDEPTFAGEVDHAALISSLEASGYDGWALSASAKSLRQLLPLCPPEARVCAWIKPIGACPLTYGLHSLWEPLIVVSGRRLRPGVSDVLRAQPARGGGSLPGRKPIAFASWLFDCLGLLPGDRIVDIFPGTGVIGRAWDELSFGADADVSAGYRGDAAQEYSGDVSPSSPDDEAPEPAGDAIPSRAALSDESPPGAGDAQA